MSERFWLVGERFAETALISRQLVLDWEQFGSLDSLGDISGWQTLPGFHERLWSLSVEGRAIEGRKFHFSACRMTRPVMSFAGTVPSNGWSVVSWWGGSSRHTKEIVDQDLAGHREETAMSIQFLTDMVSQNMWS